MTAGQAGAVPSPRSIVAVSQEISRPALMQKARAKVTTGGVRAARLVTESTCRFIAGGLVSGQRVIHLGDRLGGLRRLAGQPITIDRFLENPKEAQSLRSSIKTAATLSHVEITDLVRPIPRVALITIRTSRAAVTTHF